MLLLLTLLGVPLSAGAAGSDTGAIPPGEAGTKSFLERSPRHHEWVDIALPGKDAKLSAFVVSSTLTALAGCLFAYYRGFVSAEAFSLYLTIQYVAMIIIGGMGSVLGAVLGTVFVVLFPYAIDGGMAFLGLSERLSSVVFAVNYSAFGLVMILFLVFEPQGLVGLWRRAQNWFLLWPFKQRPLAK